MKSHRVGGSKFATKCWKTSKICYKHKSHAKQHLRQNRKSVSDGQEAVVYQCDYCGEHHIGRTRS